MQVCSALHQRYADFAPALAASLPRATAQGGLVKTANLSRKRALLRLLAELLAAGIISDTAPLVGEVQCPCTGHHKRRLLVSAAREACKAFTWRADIIEGLASADLQCSRDEAPGSLVLLTSFVRTSRDTFLGFPAEQHVPLFAQVGALHLPAAMCCHRVHATPCMSPFVTRHSCRCPISKHWTQLRRQ